ncbi:MAG: hypothetical protein EP338_06575 [Bacteroidetes bacterium]|nr:MAG: hypothetical protein EP338_06575 [Bacteroidota bacterium]
MKKINYLFVFATFTGTFMLSCQKHEESSKVAQKKSKEKQESTLLDKKLTTEAQLIMAIKQQTIQTHDLPGLREMLVESAPLNSSVLIQLIRNKVIPHELVELSCVISGPVSKEVLAALKLHRSSLHMENIIEDQHRHSNPGKETLVIYTNPISIITGEELEHQKNNSGCGDCSSTITGSPDTRLIILKEAENPDRSIRSKKCDSEKYECGRALAVRKDGGSRPSRPKYELICDTQEDVICIGSKATVK